jgi:hypothetical protein
MTNTPVGPASINSSSIVRLDLEDAELRAERDDEHLADAVVRSCEAGRIGDLTVRVERT